MFVVSLKQGKNKQRIMKTIKTKNQENKFIHY